ncbi:MAG: Holliday junction branch migration protein RuvA [Bacteroidota bacterium]
MITYVSGTLAAKSATRAVIDVQGLGYEVSVPASSSAQLPDTGKPVKLHTHYHVREDAQQLFGFVTKAERDAFVTMISVSGVGPKLALAALSAMSVAELSASVTNGDTAMLTRIPGVGKKKADRLALELRDKFAALHLPGSGMSGGGAGVKGSPEAAEARADALAALESLGVSRAQAERSLRIVLRKNPDVTSADQLIRLALRERG